MCNFFSFITLGDGKGIYIPANKRESVKDPDSHSVIAYYTNPKMGFVDTINKYEYANGQFIVDQINAKVDDRAQAEKWVKAFVKTDEFQKLCLAVVKQDGYALRFVKTQTPEICLAAVKQDGYVLKYVNDKFKYLFN